MGTLLNTAYKSQYDPDAAVSRNDCGPCCLAMLLNGLGLPATTDAVFQRTGAAANQYVSVAQLMRVAESYNAPLEFRKGLTLADLKGYLDLGKLMIALVQYAGFSEVQPGVSTQSTFKGPHFVLVVGYDEQNIIVHDPLWTGNRRQEGAFKKWPYGVWMSAWGRCHEYCDENGQCNPDFAALISVRSISAPAKAHIPADVVRRIRAKAAYDNLPQPDLTQPASWLGYYNTLGKWGARVVGRKVTSTDTLWRLAKAYYGDGNKMSVIRYFNGLAETDVIHDGQILLIPEPTLNGMISPDRVPVGSTQAGPIQ